MPLVINNSLRGRDMHTHMQTHTYIHCTGSILRNQAHTWFKKISTTFIPQLKQTFPLLWHDFYISTLKIVSPLYFETILTWFIWIWGFWSISGLLFILHWWGEFFVGRHLVERFKWECAYIKQSGVTCSAICSINHCYQWYDYISLSKSSCGLVGRWFVTLKSTWGTTGLCGGKPSDSTQSFYRAL